MVDIRAEKPRATANGDGSTKPVLLPEATYRVTLTDNGVSCTHPDGTVESVLWAALQRVEIRTNDSGPWETDVFWVLLDKGATCTVPQGATGEDALLNRLQTLPDFDNLAVVRAMGSTENAVFVCWTKK